MTNEVIATGCEDSVSTHSHLHSKRTAMFFPASSVLRHWNRRPAARATSLAHRWRTGPEQSSTWQCPGSTAAPAAAVTAAAPGRPAGTPLPQQGRIPHHLLQEALPRDAREGDRALRGCRYAAVASSTLLQGDPRPTQLPVRSAGHAYQPRAAQASSDQISRDTGH